MISMALCSQMRIFLSNFALEYAIRKEQGDQEEPKFHIISQILILKETFGK
jgi:hypothetical protein